MGMDLWLVMGGFGVWFGCLYSPLMGGHCSSSVIEQWCRQRGQIEGQTGETDGGQTVEADRGTVDTQRDRQWGQLASDRRLSSPPSSADSAAPPPSSQGGLPHLHMVTRVLPFPSPKLRPLCFVFVFLRSFLCSAQVFCLFTSVKC